jgi:hypothetical protein
MSEPSSASRETRHYSLNVAVTSIAAFTYFGNRVDEGKPRICPDYVARPSLSIRPYAVPRL